MLGYGDILDSFTEELSKHFKEKIYIEEDNVEDEKESYFFAQILPEKPTVATLYTDRKGVLMEIRYMPQAGTKKMSLYPVLSKLNCMFNRGIWVKDRHLKFTDIEPQILKDGIGNYISFLITVNYHERITDKTDNYELMQDININLKEGE